jgi:hypothetical protein
MKAFGKYCFIILAGCAIGLVIGLVDNEFLDARGRFIPQRLYLKAEYLASVTGRNWPGLDKTACSTHSR